MAIWVKRYLFTLVILLVLDVLWLGVIAPSLYQAQIGFLMAAGPNWGAAGAFYLLFVAGLVVFVISPGIEAGTPSRAAWRGAFFGLVAYATYDLTNLATLDRWPLLLTVADMAWGTSLCAATALLGVWAGRKWARNDPLSTRNQGEKGNVGKAHT